MPPEEDYLQFREAIWKALPKRKLLVGKERVMDCIAIVVQEWPDEQFALAEASGGDRDGVIRGLMSTVRRHLHLAYGEVQFGFIWTIILQALVQQLVIAIFEWWRARKSNRMDLLRWQQTWRSQES